MKFIDLINENTEEYTPEEEKLFKRAKTILNFYGEGEFENSPNTIIKYKILKCPQVHINSKTKNVRFYFSLDVKSQELEITAIGSNYDSDRRYSPSAQTGDPHNDKYFYNKYAQSIAYHIDELTEPHSVFVRYR